MKHMLTLMAAAQSTTTTNYSAIVIELFGFAMPIILAVAFNSTVKDRIKRKSDFSGVGWGLANGIIGGGVLGLLWVVIAHVSINKDIEKIKDKKYKKYVELQMKNFAKTYGICLAAWIMIVIIMVMIAVGA